MEFNRWYQMANTLKYFLRVDLQLSLLIGLACICFHCALIHFNTQASPAHVSLEDVLVCVSKYEA